MLLPDIEGDALNMQLDFDTIHELKGKKLLEILSSASLPIIIDLLCRNVNVTQMHIDIAHDYVKAMYIGETIARYCETFRAEQRLDGLRFYIRFSVTPYDNEEFASILTQLAVSFYEFEEEQNISLEDDLYNFRWKIRDRIRHCVDIADGYMANYIEGLHEWYDENPEGIEGVFKQHPEYRHRFWQPFGYGNIASNILVSPEAWIVLEDIDLIAALRDFGGFNGRQIKFTKAKFLGFGPEASLVISPSAVVSFPKSAFVAARKCVQDLLKSEESIDDWNDHLPLEVSLEEAGDVLVIADNTARFVFFKNSGYRDGMKNLSDTEMGSLIDKLSEIQVVLRRVRGEVTLLDLPWNSINDDRFEELCYEIIARRHAPNKIRKMGKSRSRDGGRDIVYFTEARAGAPPQKWIVQCKSLAVGKSLTGRSVEISDTVAQYGAHGYCIMTNGTIDSTLYDKLDSISKRVKILQEAWSRYEIELFLCKNKDIKDRYFE
jgi:hypothetical protein